MLGARDSELAAIIEDEHFVASQLAGTAYQAGSFAHSLRTTLWAEHLGGDADVLIGEWMRVSSRPERGGSDCSAP